MAVRVSTPMSPAPAGHALTEAEIQKFSTEFKEAVLGSERIQNALKEKEHWVNYQAALAQKSIELDREEAALDKRSSELSQRSQELDKESLALAQKKAELIQTRQAAEKEIERGRAMKAEAQQRTEALNEKKKVLYTPMFYGIVHGKKPLPESKTEVEKISALALEAISFDASKKGHCKVGPLLTYLDAHPELVIKTLSFKHFTGTIKELEKLNARLRNPEDPITTIHFNANFIETAKAGLAEAITAKGNKLAIK